MHQACGEKKMGRTEMHAAISVQQKLLLDIHRASVLWESKKAC